MSNHTSPSSPAVAKAAPATMNLIDTAAANGSFKTFGKAIEQAGGECCLLLLQQLNLLFDGTASDQLVDEHWFVLANAIGAVAGLGFDCRIPPGVEVDHGVGGG